MPRLPHSLLRHAHSINPLLPLLLRPCRDLPSARNELRWLQEHLAGSDGKHPLQRIRQGELRQLCLERSPGKPLQYIIGDQPFGDLDILCRPGVLIPRPETEAWAAYLAHQIASSSEFSARKQNQTFRILDLCTGTGCIALLLHSLLHHSHPSLEILGLDSSRGAISLARSNLHHNITHKNLAPSAASHIRFEEADIFKSHATWAGNAGWDIVVSNPPYISPEDFDRVTARSVRNWEPKSALVPPPGLSNTMEADAPGTVGSEHAATGDTFYPRILHIARKVGAGMVAMEVGDMSQAERVADMVRMGEGWGRCEIWRDEVDERDREDERKEVYARRVVVRGQGNGRVVVLGR